MSKKTTKTAPKSNKKTASKASAKKAPQAAGLTAPMLLAKGALDVIHRVYEDHRQGLSFSDCEKKYNLRESNGSTALRVCYLYEKLAKAD